MPATHREPEAAATGELAPEGGPGSDDRAASAAGQGAGSRAGRRPSKATLILLAKIAVGAFLCAVIAAGVDWRGALRSLASVGTILTTAMFVILLINIFVSAYKWKLLLGIHGVDYAFSRLSKYYFVAMFFNNFLPTSIGGDGYRVYKTFDNGRGKASAVVAVLMERVTGFGTLVVLGLAAAVVLAAEIGGNVSALMIMTALGCLLAPVVAWRLRGVVPRRLQEALPQKVRHMLVTIGEHADDYAKRPGRTAAVIGISILFHLVLAFAYFMILRYGAEQPVTMYQILIVLAMSNLVAVLPVSINGIGVFEGTFMYLLAQYGVPYEVSIVPMILNRGLLLVFSAMGAGVYLLDAGTGWRSAKAAA